MECTLVLERLKQIFWAGWGVKVDGSLCLGAAFGRGRFQKRTSFVWTHFDGNPVSPKWIMKDERDICVAFWP